MVLCGELWQERLGPYYTAQPSPAEKSFQHSHPQRAAGQASCDLIAHEAKVKPGEYPHLYEKEKAFSVFQQHLHLSVISLLYALKPQP